MKLAIISHTEHYLNGDGQIVGWGPTISELNHLAPHFETIYHVAMLYSKEAPPSSLPYLHSNIKFVALPPSGGTSGLSKLKTLWQSSRTISIVHNTLKKVDVFQLRTPTGMGVYLIPYLTWFCKKKGWYKYAGNWNQENPPFGYRLQRSFLKKIQSRKVTINGTWPDQPKHSYTFENPCLTISERNEGISVIKQKSYNAPFSFCFVGRLDDAKGVQRIIDAFADVDRSLLEAIHFIGNGERMEDYKKQCASVNLSTTFHGFLPREKVFDIYRSCQFLLLPSTASEGFPKVIAEGMNFGCIPMVSGVSSIGQYINESNGYVVTPTTAAVLAEILKELSVTDSEKLAQKAIQGYATASKFTFEHYNSRILKEIIENAK